MADANSTYLRTLERCTFLDNTTTVNGDGGAVYIDEAAPGSRIVNCVFANNSAAGTGDGGGVWQSSGEMTYLHCTFYTNSADFGGGLYIRDIGIASVTNCIFRGNYAASGSTRNEFYASGGSITAIDYSNVNQAESSGLDVVGANMFNTDPLFENPANYDFRLKRESPLVDAGLTLGNVVFDRNGVARPQGSASDIGAFEVISDPSALIFTIL
jgi:hypothetical protein